jgi:hypothetical protein
MVKHSDAHAEFAYYQIMFTSREDLARRSAARLLGSPDKDLEAMANELFVRLAPTVTRRETYGSADLIAAGAEFLLQGATFLYAIVSDRRNHARSGGTEAELREAIRELSEGSRLTAQQIEALTTAMIETFNERREGVGSPAATEPAQDRPEYSGDSP